MLVRRIINSLLGRWGKPDEYAKEIAPWGIFPMDRGTGGIRLRNNGIFLVQGSEGSRKTSHVVAVWTNEMLSGKVPEGYFFEYDTLETGMTVQRMIETFICQLATRILVYWHWWKTNDEDVIALFSKGLDRFKVPINALVEQVGFIGEDGSLRRETVLKPEFLRGGRWTLRQKKAIELATRIVSEFPLYIDGLSEDDEDESRAQGKPFVPTTNTWYLDVAYEHWRKRSREDGVMQIAVDNVQEYIFQDGLTNEYEILNRVVPVASSWQKEFKGLMWLISQVGVGQRQLEKTGDVPTAAGGARIARQAQFAEHLKYNPRECPWYYMTNTVKTRIGWVPDQAIFIDPESGAPIGRAVPMSELPPEFRR